ncbi:L-threonylcarbamoyladenylate synthase [Flaviflagellibacter deserti]|uniref:Threonylcarbamoyl-AMP synthase n=1 Tax=Flaviflagellibacter deserti TaxID=2267266 RepID=A0ABV9Z0F4_9HYPH
MSTETTVSPKILTPDTNAIGKAVWALASGELVAFPTETVYGLGADARNGRAIASIYETKGRPSFNPLIAHVTGIDAAREAGGMFDERAVKLAKAFWPGPLTLVVPCTADCAVHELARAGLDTLALRAPAHPVAQKLLDEFGAPVVAPSANKSGHVSPTRAEHVASDLTEGVSIILDGGPTEVGVESTVVACLPGEPVRLLRPGGVTREEIERVTGEVLGEASEAVQSPGMLAQHYAPRAAVRLNATEIAGGEAWLGFGEIAPLGGRGIAHLNLSPTGDLAEAAANLFAYLRELDALAPTAIAVAAVPDTGLGEAINDRLRRAATR